MFFFSEVLSHLKLCHSSVLLCLGCTTNTLYFWSISSTPRALFSRPSFYNPTSNIWWANQIIKFLLFSVCQPPVTSWLIYSNIRFNCLLQKVFVFVPLMWQPELHTRKKNPVWSYFFYCFTVHFNSLNLTYQLMHFYIQ